jgi:hypothetical protein
MLTYMWNNWKLVIHLLLGTYYFGVNNKWWCDFPSIFGIPIRNRTPKRIIQNYRGMKMRAIHCGFVSKSTAKKLFPFHKFN